MALVCPTDLSGVDVGFTEFIDCSTLTINYTELGSAILNFTVVAATSDPSPTLYTDLIFGGINFTGYVSNLEVRRISGTLVYEHTYTINATGCAI